MGLMEDLGEGCTFTYKVNEEVSIRRGTVDGPIVLKVSDGVEKADLTCNRVKAIAMMWVDEEKELRLVIESENSTGKYMRMELVQ